MKDLLIGFFLGLVVGFSGAVGYYDGVVAQDYKDQIKQAKEAIISYDSALSKKDEQIEQLLQIIQLMKKQNNSFKFTSLEQ